MKDVDKKIYTTVDDGSKMPPWCERRKAIVDSFETYGIPELQSPLKTRFKFPPFSVWNARDTDWQDRRRRWMRLGIRSEVGRKEIKTYHTSGLSYVKMPNDTSTFDPVICELVYSWFCPPEGQIIDPFAGGSVRGIVASIMDYKYWGCDLSAKQLKANAQQLGPKTQGAFKPVWVQGDSFTELAAAPTADLLFSCPPYGNLEVYSDAPNDISNMEYPVFRKRYAAIINKGCQRLRNNRFACFVVANFRDRETAVMQDLCGDTIRAFKKAGLAFYNDIVLIHPAGSVPIRTNNIFVKGKSKVVKLHQNVLVFVKGKPQSFIGKPAPQR